MLPFGLFLKHLIVISCLLSPSATEDALVTQSVNLEIKVEIALEGGGLKLVPFKYNSKTLETAASNFCSLYNIMVSRCNALRALAFSKLEKLSTTLPRHFDAVEAGVRIEIPIELRSEKGRSDVVKFIYDPSVSSSSLEESVLFFCDQYAVKHAYCTNLMLHTVKTLNELSFGEDSYIFNPHLPRHQDAYESEILNKFRALYAKNSSAKMTDNEEGAIVEANVNLRIWQDFSALTNKTEGFESAIVRRVCFIHSCTLKSSGSSILLEILSHLNDSGLIGELTHIWVLNYGEEIVQSAMNLIAQKYPKVTCIHRSSETFHFEVPTLRHLQHFASQIAANTPHEAPTQILYLHTKGVSYDGSVQQIHDWRNMMLHFLVRQHRKCYHLLASEEFDTLGTNYVSVPRFYSGNMWWTTAEYAARLIPLNPVTSNKFDAERWLLSGDARAFVLHSSDTDHANERYPAEKYAQEKPAAAYSRSVCSH